MIHIYIYMMLRDGIGEPWSLVLPNVPEMILFMGVGTEKKRG